MMEKDIDQDRADETEKETFSYEDCCTDEASCDDPCCEEVCCCG